MSCCKKSEVKQIATINLVKELNVEWITERKKTNQTYKERLGPQNKGEEARITQMGFKFDISFML